MEEIKNKYYIRIDEKKRIIKVFADILEKAEEGDISIGEGEGSQFRACKQSLSEELQMFADVENGLQLVDANGLYCLKYENELICKVSENDADYLEFVKSEKYRELTDACNKSILAGFKTTDGLFYQFEEKDQANFTQQTILLIMDSNISKVIWESGKNDGKFKEYSKEEFMNIVAQAQKHKSDNISKLAVLRAKLGTTKTVEEIKCISWE